MHIRRSSEGSFGRFIHRFSAVQVAVYEAVLRVQRACVAQCRPGTTLQHLQQLMLSLLEDELQELRIVDTKLDHSEKRKVMFFFCLFFRTQHKAASSIIGRGNGCAAYV